MDDGDAIKAFQIAVYRQNMYTKLFKFEATVKEISGMDAFEAEQAGKLYDSAQRSSTNVTRFFFRSD